MASFILHIAQTTPAWVVGARAQGPQQDMQSFQGPRVCCRSRAQPLCRTGQPQGTSLAPPITGNSAHPLLLQRLSVPVAQESSHLSQGAAAGHGSISLPTPPGGTPMVCWPPGAPPTQPCPLHLAVSTASRGFSWPSFCIPSAGRAWLSNFCCICRRQLYGDGTYTPQHLPDEVCGSAVLGLTTPPSCPCVPPALYLGQHQPVCLRPGLPGTRQVTQWPPLATCTHRLCAEPPYVKA